MMIHEQRILLLLRGGGGGHAPGRGGSSSSGGGCCHAVGDTQLRFGPLGVVRRRTQPAFQTGDERPQPCELALRGRPRIRGGQRRSALPRRQLLLQMVQEPVRQGPVRATSGLRVKG